MATPAVYRFLPWTRRGLVAELVDSDNAAVGPLPAHAAVKLDITLTGGNGAGSTSTQIAGPGDVVGLDPAEIVRVTPRPDAGNVEPNFLAAIDFDDATLPWMMTPSAANSRGQLRPWLALVVVEDRPGVTISVVPGTPLPRLDIESGAQNELQSLDESWAWAHTQILVDEGTGPTAAAMASDPDRHVSRLVCPRRLRPNTRWHACLVPAFDAGVVRGLGLTPVAAQLAPAWTDGDSATLPVYFHWDFGTGADGDFESLARRLRPFQIADENGVPSVGTVLMHIGDAGGAANLPADHDGRIVEMDGALRALQQKDGTLDDITDDLRTPLGTLLDDIADPSGSDADDGAVGPPLYGSWAANRFAVSGEKSGWFAELNLDPRARVAAGLGAEVMRRNQEDLMTAAWHQVGDVLTANALLSRGRLSIEASAFLHAKSLAKLPAERVLTYAAPLATRTLLGAVTVSAAITPTSLPAATIDPAMRRLVSPTARIVRKNALHTKTDLSSLSTGLVSKLARGSSLADPTGFTPSGVLPPAGRVPTKVAGGSIDLTPIGIPVVRSAVDGAAILEGIATARATRVPDAAGKIVLRGDLRTSGLVVTRHVDLVRQLPAGISDAARPGADILIGLREAGVAHTGTSGFVIGRAARGETLDFEPVDITSRGTIELRTGPTSPNVVVGRVSNAAGTGRDLARDIGRIPVGSISRDAAPIVVRTGTVSGEITVTPGIERPAPGPLLGEVDAIFTGATATLPPLVTDSAVITRFEKAVGQVDLVSVIAQPVVAGRIVAYALAEASAALTARCVPAVAHSARLGSMVRFGDRSLTELRAAAVGSAITVAPLFDRVMAYPQIGAAAYRMLAAYDRARLLPGVDEIPPDSVTLLETKPRFIAAFLAGLNHEFSRELLWRRYPTDQRGTPVRRFWDSDTGAPDIPPMHQWNSSLAKAAGGKSNLVLLVRGELLRRYPNTTVVAIKSLDSGMPSTGEGPDEFQRPIFSGLIDPDIAFYGFDLEDEQIIEGPGWFFALQEQITEPRFALDELVDPARGPLTAWRQAAWPDTSVAPGSPFRVADLDRIASAAPLGPPLLNGASVAEALFQNPVQVLVHGKNLTTADD